MPDTGGIRIVQGSNGDLGRVVLTRFIRWLPGLAMAAFVGYTGQWFIQWRATAATNVILERALHDIVELRQDLKDEHTFSTDHYMTRAEWLAAKELSDYKLVDGLDRIARQVASNAVVTHRTLETAQHIQGIAEKLPLPKEKH
jgi:hypothetical protein